MPPKPRPAPPAMPQGGQARLAAVGLLLAVLEEGEMLGAAAEVQLASLPPEDRARALRLAGATLRHLGRCDAILAPFLRKPPPPFVLNLLRLSACELWGEAAAAHGVTDTAVRLTRAADRHEGLAGLVNAVLRKVAEAREAGPAWADLPPQRLPGWLRRRLVKAWGADAVAAIEAVQAQDPPIDLTPREGDADALAARLGGIALPTGSVRMPGRVQVSALEGYADGAFWVQDAAAALPARALAVQPGDRVLDLCAAPGGKALQLAAAVADVTALDISGPRMERLAENLARTGLRATAVVADALHWQAAPFDAVLLDPPCTATGTIRRHPDLPLLRKPGDLPGLIELQTALVDRAVALLRPGGRLVVCTCSLLPEEGEHLAELALARHPALRAAPELLDLPGVPADWHSAAGLRLRPDRWAETGGMDGFFIAAFRKL